MPIIKCTKSKLGKTVVAKSVESALGIPVTLITASTPDCVTKEFSLNEDGSLHKTTTAYVSAGTMKTETVNSLEGVSELLQNMAYNQCLAFGITGRDMVNLMTERAWAAAGCPDDAMPRSIKHMYWNKEHGVLMLDYDAPKDGKPLTREELVESLVNACPWLSKVAMLWFPSTSSCLYLGEKKLSGINGQRIYVLVKNAADIPRLGKLINTLLWANDVGRYEISKSGSLLERGQFDSSVWQPNRIDFASGAKCNHGIEQRRGAPVHIDGEISVLDSLAVPEPSTEIKERAKANKAKAKGEKREEAAKVRLEWVESRSADLVKNTPEISTERAESTVRRAVESRVLMGDWVLWVVHEGSVKPFTVRHILDNPSEFHRLETLDPLEPEYDDSRAVGMLFLLGARKAVYTFAHGGATFKLARQPVDIEVVKGKIRDTTDATIELLRQATDVFDFGSGIVTLGSNGSLLPLDGSSLSYILAGFIQFYTRKTTDKGACDSFINPPVGVCGNILALSGVRELKKLVAVITAPTLRPDGSVLSSPGYDASTGLLYDTIEHPPSIHDAPTKEQAAAALERFWKPFAEFPFATALDAAVCLAAGLTAVVRPALSTAPAFANDAPTQSSGKTLMARCYGVLATGIEPGIYPHTASGSDEETRKRLFAALRAGEHVHILDNVLGTYNSAAMAGLLTSDVYRDRVLGNSEVACVPNRMLVVITGNNLSFGGDMARRTLSCRIDPQTDQPFARQFNLNPVQYCLEHRQQMVADALTLIRFYLSSGVPALGKGRMGSFEAWDAWVRQTVLYVDRELAHGKFGDVMDKVILNRVADPEQQSLGMLLHAWYKLYGSAWQTVNVAMGDYNDGCGGAKTSDQLALAWAISDIYVGAQKLNTKSLGRLLMYRKDRIVDGMRLEQSNSGKSGSSWRVCILSTVPKPT